MLLWSKGGVVNPGWCMSPHDVVGGGSSDQAQGLGPGPAAGDAEGEGSLLARCGCVNCHGGWRAGWRPVRPVTVGPGGVASGVAHLPS